jgi:hypothetical protein
MGVGLVGLGFFRDKVRGKKAGEQTSSSPAFACTGKEDGEQCHQNGHCLLPFFNFSEQCLELWRFAQNASFHLKENGSKTC